MTETLEIKINNLKFDCIAAGNKEDELVIFLHGFPESSYMWKKLITNISKNGFYCIAPNLRGYSIGACPEGKENYTLDKLAADVFNIFKFFNKPKFHLVGHDWGAAIGWKVVHDYKDLIFSWTGVSVPHIQAFGNAMVNDVEQNKMSQYIKNFQLPSLPEMEIQKNDFQFFRELWKSSDSYEVNSYLKIFRNPKQLTAAINYYRINYKLLKKAANEQILGNIHVPTLFIWGNRDIAIGSHSVKNNHQYMKGEYEFIELDSGHWLIQTNYKDLKKAIKNHLNRNKNLKI